MLDFSLIKYFLELLNKHISHVFYLQPKINIFQMYFLFSVNEATFYDDL